MSRLDVCLEHATNEDIEIFRHCHLRVLFLFVFRFISCRKSYLGNENLNKIEIEEICAVGKLEVFVISL